MFPRRFKFLPLDVENSAWDPFHTRILLFLIKFILVRRVVDLVLDRLVSLVPSDVVVPKFLRLVFQILEHINQSLHRAFLAFLRSPLRLLLQLLENKLVFVITQLLLEFHSERFGGGNAEVLPLVAPLERSFNVHVVVFDDSQNDV